MTPAKLPRTIRLDPSDRFVFDHPAEPGEWAVTGSFLFMDAEPASLTGKARAAFRSGFVGVESLGFSTLVVVSEASETDVEEAVETLARQLVARVGAPDLDIARGAAREEVLFAASICQPRVNSILAMHRTFLEGEIREQFRTLERRESGSPGEDRLHASLRVFQFVETDEGEGEDLDLAALAERKRP